MRCIRYRGLEKSGAYDACFAEMSLKNWSLSGGSICLHIFIIQNRQKYQSTLLVKRKLILLSIMIFLTSTFTPAVGLEPTTS